MGMMVSSVATTCEARIRSAINSYSGSARLATSPHQTDWVAREISNPCRAKISFHVMEIIRLNPQDRGIYQV
jgi:hypothetical protein